MGLEIVHKHHIIYGLIEEYGIKNS